ncbi:MAG: Cys-tRNA(Pro) deacylase [Candidatus Kapaibacterium sp.]|jgi:Cys-tRNA(Pro)/Cys-tRNA(Cys) deacylase
MRAVKTNVCRVLDAAKIGYTLIEYSVNDNELDAVSVAKKIGLPPEKVFKTLVLQGSFLPYFVVVVQSVKELSLKSAALQTNNKSCAMLPQKELLSITGYIRGGCSPIGMKKKFPTFLDESALTFDTISISPGVRGQQILISPHDLMAITQAKIIRCE